MGVGFFGGGCQQVMFLPNVVLCQCTSFDVEKLLIFIFFGTFFQFSQHHCKSFQKATSESLENMALIHGSLIVAI
jgi:hypothetical protein